MNPVCGKHVMALPDIPKILLACPAMYEKHYNIWWLAESDQSRPHNTDVARGDAS